MYLGTLLYVHECTDKTKHQQEGLLYLNVCTTGRVEGLAQFSSF